MRHVLLSDGSIGGEWVVGDGSATPVVRNTQSANGPFRGWPNYSAGCSSDAAAGQQQQRQKQTVNGIKDSSGKVTLAFSIYGGHYTVICRAAVGLVRDRILAHVGGIACLRHPAAVDAQPDSGWGEVNIIPPGVLRFDLQPVPVAGTLQPWERRYSKRRPG